MCFGFTLGTYTWLGAWDVEEEGMVLELWDTLDDAEMEVDAGAKTEVDVDDGANVNADDDAEAGATCELDAVEDVKEADGMDVWSRVWDEDEWISKLVEQQVKQKNERN